MAALSIDSITGVSDKVYVDDVSEKQNAPAKDERPNGFIIDSQQRVAEERRLIHKLDIRLMPIITLIFIINYIDVCLLLFALIVGSLHEIDSSFAWP